MAQQRYIDLIVGLFMITGILALTFLALRVSGLTSYSVDDKYYRVMAEFDNIGGLKVRAPVTVAGVRVGQVGDINLDKTSFRAKVTLLIDGNQKEIPIDTTANIYTQGLLGANYISLSPGYADQFLKNGDKIENTNSAMVLEKLIGQFIFSMQNNSKKPAAQ